MGGASATSFDEAAEANAARSRKVRRPRIHEGKIEGSTLHFKLEVKRPDGERAFSVCCTLGEFQRAHSELKDSLKDWGHHDMRDLKVKDLPDIGLPADAHPAASMEPWMREACVRLQDWLDEVVDASLLPTCPSLQNLLDTPSGLHLGAARRMVGLTTLIECHQPLLLEIASYLLDSPTDLANFAHHTSRLLSRQIPFAADSLWRSSFAARWPAFHECLAFHSERNWKDLYGCTLGGKREYVLEVFDREKKLGFAMAAMVVRITYERATKTFVARYLGASGAFPEVIPAHEAHRLRFCPPSARARLQPGSAVESGPNGQGQPWCYMHRVLEGHEDLAVGRGVELQWRMDLASPFGWWYCHLERLRRDADGKLATATITFPHFLSTSRWYRLEVRFGDAEMRPCPFGGYTGGLRAASAAEREHWMRYFPQEPFAF